MPFVYFSYGVRCTLNKKHYLYGVKVIIVTHGKEFKSAHKTFKDACHEYGIKPPTVYRQLNRTQSSTYTSKTGITLTKTTLK